MGCFTNNFNIVLVRGDRLFKGFLPFFLFGNLEIIKISWQ